MYIETYKEELMEYIKSSLAKLPYKSMMSPFDRIEITGEVNNKGEFKVESGILFDMCDAENVVMSGCVWYDYGTIYLITRNEDYLHYYGSDCLYYGHPDTCVGFEEFLKISLPEVPAGILKLPENIQTFDKYVEHLEELGLKEKPKGILKIPAHMMIG